MIRIGAWVCASVAILAACSGATHATTSGAAPSRNASLDALAARAWAHSESRLRRAAETLDPKDGYPKFTNPDGTWSQKSATTWTSGFFPGALWYMYEHTRDPFWRGQAARWTAGLEEMADVTRTHDLGFVLFTSFGNGYRLTGDAHDSAVVIHGSRTLMKRYSPVVGSIKSWDLEQATDRRKTWEFPVIVDNLMNLEMLFWAADHGGDPAWKANAERHALTSLRELQRPDGSMFHVVSFDPRTGAAKIKDTWQGYADSSAWARGQAWAIYGFGMAYDRTRNRTLLDGAVRAADYFIANLPPDKVPYWDFRLPDTTGAKRDASAGAVAASGLFELSRLTSGEQSRRYREAAESMLAALCSSYLTAGTSNAAILAHSVGQLPQGVEIDVGIAYADYYFLEALLRYARLGRG
jgi:unsaturated chondroitin disaccharide hydrolase